LYKESYTTWTITLTDPNNAANANPNTTCVYDATKHDTIKDVSAITELDGDADGWISPAGAEKVIESVHEKWVNLALLHYDEDELEELDSATQDTVMEYAVDPEIRDCNTECMCATPYPSDTQKAYINNIVYIFCGIITIILFFAANATGGLLIEEESDDKKKLNADIK